MQFISSDPSAIAIVTTISGIIGLAAAYPGGRLSDKISRKGIVINSGAFARLMTAVIPVARDLGSYISLYT